MNICKAKNCNSVENKDTDVTFHKFPIFDSKLLKSWLDNIAPPNYLPQAEDYVCSNHFSDDQFINNSKPRRLIRYAVPTIIKDLSNDKNVNKLPIGNVKVQNKHNVTKRKKSMEDNSNISIESSEESSSDLSSVSDDEYNLPLNKINKRKKSGTYKTKFVGGCKQKDLQYPEQLKKIWEIDQKEVNEQRVKIKTLQQKNKRLESQVIRLRNIIRHLKSVHK